MNVPTRNVEERPREEVDLGNKEEETELETHCIDGARRSSPRRPPPPPLTDPTSHVVQSPKKASKEWSYEVSRPVPPFLTP